MTVEIIFPSLYKKKKSKKQKKQNKETPSSLKIQLQLSLATYTYIHTYLREWVCVCFSWQPSIKQSLYIHQESNLMTYSLLEQYLIETYYFSLHCTLAIIIPPHR